MHRILIISLMSLGCSSIGQASEARFGIDTTLDVRALAASGEVVARVDRQGALYYADASAVLSVDVDRLAEVSSNYDRYVQYGMPNLKESITVRNDGDRRWIWTHMEGIATTSYHYLEARIHDRLDSTGARGIEWELFRPDASSGREFGRLNQPAFQRLDGSWYMQPLPGGKVYVRYFIVADLSITLPDALLSGVVRRQIREGVKQVIRVLARAATVRQ